LLRQFSGGARTQNFLHLAKFPPEAKISSARENLVNFPENIFLLHLVAYYFKAAQSWAGKHYQICRCIVVGSVAEPVHFCAVRLRLQLGPFSPNNEEKFYDFHGFQKIS
jgi:hypothetical protein